MDSTAVGNLKALLKHPEIKSAIISIAKTIPYNLAQRLYVVVESDTASLRKDCGKLLLENREQAAGLDVLREQCSKQEQDTKINNIRITGMKEMPGEQTKEKVINFNKEKMKIHVPVDDVQTAERIGLKKEDSP